MKRNPWTRSALQLAIATTLGVGLAGCGGGGSDSPPPPPATVDLTTANSDTVAHASVGGVFAMNPGQSVPLAGAANAMDRSSAQSASTPRSSAWLSRVVAVAKAPASGTVLAADRHQARALAVLGPVNQPCAISGTSSVTLNFADLNTVTPGDVMTIAYHDCMDFAGETLDGTVVATYLQISPDFTSLQARMVMTNLADVTERHAVTTDGSMLLDFSMVGSTVEITRLTAEGSVRTTVSNHLPFNDTVTLSDGFFNEMTYDSSIFPPAGVTGFGRSITTFGGTLQSVAAGGTVVVSSVPGEPMTQYGDQAYPSSGAAKIKGRTGTLTLTALSDASVRLSLDANDDGVPESNETVTWDWLF